MTACSTSEPSVPGGVLIASDTALDFEGTLAAQEQIIRLQREQLERQQRELLELKRQAELNERTRSFTPAQ